MYRKRKGSNIQDSKANCILFLRQTLILHVGVSDAQKQNTTLHAKQIQNPKQRSVSAVILSNWSQYSCFLTTFFGVHSEYWDLFDFSFFGNHQITLIPIDSLESDVFLLNTGISLISLTSCNQAVYKLEWRAFGTEVVKFST